MSNYKGHNLFNLIFFLPITLAGIFYFFTQNGEHLCLYAGGFIFATFFMSPDSDIADKIKMNSLRGVLSLPFRLYSKFFKHRGISHWIVVGTFTRIFWLVLLFAICYTLLYQRTLSLEPLISFYKAHTLSVNYAIAGFCIADIGHLILD